MGEENWALQELIPGHFEYSTSLLVEQGKILNAICTRYEYSNEAYVWPHNVTEIGRKIGDLPSEHLDVMRSFLAGYNGFCNFNYKVQSDGKLRLFEINARIGADLACDASGNWPDLARAMFEKLDAVDHRREVMEALGALQQLSLTEREVVNEAEKNETDGDDAVDRYRYAEEDVDLFQLDLRMDANDRWEEVLDHVRESHVYKEGAWAWTVWIESQVHEASGEAGVRSAHTQLRRRVGLSLGTSLEWQTDWGLPEVENSWYHAPQSRKSQSESLCSHARRHGNFVWTHVSDDQFETFGSTVSEIIINSDGGMRESRVACGVYLDVVCEGQRVRVYSMGILVLVLVLYLDVVCEGQRVRVYSMGISLGNRSRLEADIWGAKSSIYLLAKFLENVCT